MRAVDGRYPLLPLSSLFTSSHITSVHTPLLHRLITQPATHHPSTTSSSPPSTYHNLVSLLPHTVSAVVTTLSSKYPGRTLPGVKNRLISSVLGDTAVVFTPRRITGNVFSGGDDMSDSGTMPQRGVGVASDDWVLCVESDSPTSAGVSVIQMRR